MSKRPGGPGASPSPSSSKGSGSRPAGGCKNHPDREIDEVFGVDDRTCTECTARNMNAGFAMADATWWQQPHERKTGPNAPHPMDRYTCEGRDVLEIHKRRNGGEE